ncbi:MAG: right-handed parallel beta-helix repeat-containing protein [Bradymonadales bacterium]|nr:right-handed parallel beta-helix repeat-containing protein [Bradymonadales bacterium]
MRKQVTCPNRFLLPALLSGLTLFCGDPDTRPPIGDDDADTREEVSDLVDQLAEIQDDPDPTDPVVDTDAEPSGDQGAIDADDDGDQADRELDLPSIPEAIELSIEDAEYAGDVPRLTDGRGQPYRLMSSDGSAVWEVVVTRPSLALLEVQASLFRQEGAHLAVTVGSSTTNAQLLDGHGIPHWLSLVAPEDQERQRGAGIDYDPRPLRLDLQEGTNRIELRPDHPAGHLQLYGCRLAPVADAALRPLEEGVVAELTPEGTVAVVNPCSEPDCDDAEVIRDLLAAHPERVVIQLVEGSYLFSSPLTINRSNVLVVGARADATRITWDPLEAYGSGARAIRFVGEGPTVPHVLLVEPVEAETRHLVLPAGTPLEVGAVVHLTSDDYGEIPPLCVGGRDEERQIRHVNWMATVVEIQDTERGRVLWLDRHVGYDLPLQANPRVAPIRPVEGVGVANLSLLAACPQADLLAPYTTLAADCDNPFVLDHSAIGFQWAVNGLVSEVWVTRFGRYAVEVITSLDTRVFWGGMTRPADYGDGGKGYGVHAIRSGRTLIQQYQVAQARHAVVIDFGSTETQVIDSDLDTTSLAAVDVHGEASYDTLILGNRITDSVQGVIVGGGGREVHCNDGPRHHVVSNLIEGSTVAGVWLTDYSTQVSLRHNTIERSYVSVYIDAGSSELWIYRNHLLEADGSHLWIRDASRGTGPIRLTQNLMDGEPPGYWIEAGIELLEEESWFLP